MTADENGGGSDHFGSRAFDHPGAHARVVPAAVSSFDEVTHRLEEELRLAGFVVVSAAVGSSSSSEDGAASSSSSTLSSSPVCPAGSGRAVTLTVLRQEPPSRALLARRPGLCPLLPSVVCTCESGGPGGVSVVSAAAPAALPALLEKEQWRRRRIAAGEAGAGRGKREPEEAEADDAADAEALAALRSADAALRAALESVFRLPKMASPPGTYAWPPVRGLPAVGGSAAVAGGKARSQARREEELAARR